MKIKIAVFLFLVAFFAIQAQNKGSQLENKLYELIKDFNGDVGIFVHNLKTKEEVAINADTVFPTASIVKVPILVGLFDKINKGSFHLNDTLIYRDSIKYGGSGLMQFYRDSTVTDLRTLASLMITMSDNTTSLWIQGMVGGVYINNLMSDLGLEHTRVNSRTKGREKDWERYGWGQTTPREMAGLLIKMRNRELIGPAASDEMYRLLTNSFYTEYSLSQIPPYVQTAAKQGMVNRSRSELVMVNAPNGDYVFYIATKNNGDESWKFSNEAWQLQRGLSALLWQYFEPNSTWEPAPGFEKLIGDLRY